MKKTLTFACSSLVAVLLIFSACKKGDEGPAGPAGPAGPQGPAGAQGPQGIAGNANVTQYTYGAHNFATSAIAALTVTTTADTMNRSAWFVYLVRSSGNIYPIPGFGLNGTSDYRVYWSHFSNKANFTISKVSGAGEEYTNIRIIRIYANTATAGGRIGLPAIDFTDYYAVCKYYNLPY
ncbi:hypothetical protein [Longitalea luteola]|uniref:hypothetical protein n=1 Tax=Longitalea luteola TaxID=2812563 RepID=UPI001A971754|nr:hypothetical protein [Longitalea luteola]